MREYYVYDVPVFCIDNPEAEENVPNFCKEAEEYMSPSLLTNVDVIYVGNFKELENRNATYANGAIYMTADEPTSFDMLENFIHEVAHSLEYQYGMALYTDDLRDEFLGKRERLYHILESAGYHISPLLYSFTEYNARFDEFLANEVGYPTLLSLTMGLFASPYAATSLQEYFANGFEKYFLDNPRTVRDTSPILYRKIEEILDDQT
ncbi:MAG TPA: hypothetical protein EYN67_06255 [Flavobacteriales bacterium]|nr:hypothetical protein [Flavobacteriales bacterium]